MSKEKDGAREENIIKRLQALPSRLRRKLGAKYQSGVSEEGCETCGEPVGVCSFGQIKRFCSKECRRKR